MTFLPVVERELRVAARKRSTFWLRIIAVLVALAIGGGVLVLSTVGFGFGTAGLGRGLFLTLTWLSLGLALSAGLFFTSDCLSEEKREGTLGFLFLTDLSGYDVVLGKLLATSLRGLYALLAVLPVLGVALIMGGVTGLEFWKTSLALVNALFVSLAAGLFVSAISRESQKAMAATLLLLLGLVAGGPAMDSLIAAATPRNVGPVLRLSSPAYLFAEAATWGRSSFWRALLVNQAVAWTLLGLSCVLLPRTWQERASKGLDRPESWGQWWKYGGARRRAALRQKLVGINPVLWLACRERWQSLALWILTLLAVAGAAIVIATDDDQGSWILWNYFGGVVTLALYLGITSQAGRFFVEARRNGLLELLLATPLAAHRIVQGQWRALLRMFGVPLSLYLVAQLVATFMAQQAWAQVAATATTTAAAPPPPAATNATFSNSVTVTTTTTGTGTTAAVSLGGFTAPSLLVTLAISCAGTLTIAANLAALVWFAMWMGLTSKNTNLATLKAIVFVQIIPWFVITFAAWMIVPMLLLPLLFTGGTSAPMQMMVLFPLLVSAVGTFLYLVKDVAFVLLARRKLYSDFRERVVQATAPILPALPPPLPEAARPASATN